EPAAIKVQGLAFLSVAYRKWTDDAKPGDAGEDLRSAQRWSEPVLHSGIRRRSAAGRSVHPGTASVPAATGLGTMAVDPEEAAGDQRSRERSTGESAPYR